MDAVPFEAPVNSIDEVLIPKWLGEEFDRPGLHGSDRHRYVAMAGNEHDRHPHTLRREFALEFKSADIRESDVKDEASWPKSLSFGKE
ncbi:hypothetical protein MesoLjLa_56400 [Mesorhizobium sp. L-2-11]|nr:hypothetical protein MesoLjLa_56400 [Mesorhizobium sp. L-2-11]